jgi:hypothetical protein
MTDAGKVRDDEEPQSIADWWCIRVSWRPHHVIGHDPTNPYLLRWFLVPRNPSSTSTGIASASPIPVSRAIIHGISRPSCCVGATEKSPNTAPSCAGLDRWRSVEPAPGIESSCLATRSQR